MCIVHHECALPGILRSLVPVLPRALGAKLGAIRCGLLRTAMDGYGQRTVWFRTLWTATDGYGRVASIYGSEGWGFEFLRACYSQGFRGSRNPVAGLTTGQLTTVVIRGPGVSLAFRAHAPNALSCPYRAPTDASCRPAPTA